MSREAQARTALLLTATTTFFMIGSGMAIFGPTLPVFAREFHLSTSGIGSLVSVQWMGSLSGTVALYFWGQRMTPQLPLAIAAIGAAILALTPWWPLALLGAFVFGLGYGSVAAMLNPRVLRAFGARGPALLSLINALFSLGAILAPFGFVMLGQNPRPVFGAIAVYSVVVWIIARPVGLTGLSPDSVGKGFTLHWPILGLILASIGIEVSLASLGPTALIRTGMAEDAAAWLLSVYFIVSLATRLVLALLAHRLPAFGLLTFALLWAAACALGAVYLGPLVFFPAMGVSAGLFFQGGYVTALRKMGDDPRVSAIVMGVGPLGAVISPLIYARLMQDMGDTGFFWLIAAVAGVLGLLSLASYRSMSR
jgi:MFS transporter, FHS family, glucose/mannose:H+ symporter